MATRGAYGVKIDGKYRLNYHHFDSFPEYLGRDICSLIAEINRDGGWDVFTTNFRKVALVYPGDTAPDELVQRYKHPNEEDDGKGVAEWYNLLRGFQGARLLRGIYKGVHPCNIQKPFLRTFRRRRILFGIRTVNTRTPSIATKWFLNITGVDRPRPSPAIPSVLPPTPTAIIHAGLS